MLDNAGIKRIQGSVSMPSPIRRGGIGRAWNRGPHADPPPSEGLVPFVFEASSGGGASGLPDGGRTRAARAYPSFLCLLLCLKCRFSML